MSSYQGDEVCITCGKTYLYEFNLKTSERIKLTCCDCDVPKKSKRSKLPSRIDLINYIGYVETFPDSHEVTDYPVCFNEWFSNDRIETEEVSHD